MRPLEEAMAFTAVRAATRLVLVTATYGLGLAGV
jgi:hypothetical protein